MSSNSNMEGKRRESQEYQGGRWKVRRLAVTRKASGDIDGSTKEVEGRWGDEQQQQHGRQEERLPGVPRKGVEISSSKQSKRSTEHGLAGVPSRLRKGGEQQEHGRQEERLAGVPSKEAAERWGD